jgi:hypothetical protein
MKTLVNISRLRLSENPLDAIEQLRKAAADFEIDIYKKQQASPTGDIAALTAEVNSLKLIVQALQLTTFPGFGTDHLHKTRFLQNREANLPH